MNTDYNNIFSQDACLTTDELTNYLSGNLSVNELRKVEHHISDCQMCNDELEGLQNLNNIEKLTQIIFSLNNKIDSHFNKKNYAIPLEDKNEKQKSFNFKKTFSIAASIALLITAGYFIYDINQTTSDSNIAEANIPENNIIQEENAVLESENSEKDAVEETEDNFIETKETNKEDNSTNSSNKPQIENNEVSTKEEITKNDEEVIKSVDEIADVLEEETPVTELVDENSTEKLNVAKKEKINNDKSSPNTMFGTTRGADVLRKKESVKDYMYLKDSGILSYNIKSYKDAISDLNKYLEHKPNDFEVIYKLGMSYYYTNKYDVAISKFNKIISTQNIKYFENAQWYKANALLKQNKKDDALIILKDIAKKAGKFSEKAKNKISEIEE